MATPYVYDWSKNDNILFCLGLAIRGRAIFDRMSNLVDIHPTVRLDHTVERKKRVASALGNQSCNQQQTQLKFCLRWGYRDREENVRFDRRHSLPALGVSGRYAEAICRRDRNLRVEQGSSASHYRPSPVRVRRLLGIYCGCSRRPAKNRESPGRIYELDAIVWCYLTVGRGTLFGHSNCLG